MKLNVIVDCPPWATKAELFFSNDGGKLESVRWKREAHIRWVDMGPWEEVKDEQ